MTRPASRPVTATIAVAGAGIVGLVFALAVKTHLRAAIAVRVHDPLLATPPADRHRYFAIAPSSRSFLAELGIWDRIAPEAQPIHRMEITDSRLTDPIRPTLLTFGADAAPDMQRDMESDGEARPLAHMVPGHALRVALLAALADAGVELEPAAIQTMESGPHRTIVTTSDGRAAEVDLVVAADGARSRLRERAGLGWVGRPYRQHGIVATISHERDHEGRAIQHFLPSGPFAILPLTPGGALGHRSSIVWSERDDHVATLRHLDADDVLAEVQRRFGDELGRIVLETPITPYPLAVGIARGFVAHRFAVIGDAAHVIHPIAGQGLNLGLADAHMLSGQIVEAVRLGLDAGDASVLTDYERARRPAAVAMGAATDGINRLFANDVLAVRLVRDLGLGLVERLPAVKSFFVRQAEGRGSRRSI